MNENEFFRGIEGEEQNGTDLVSGAEHLVRLKIQSGQQTQQQYPDLELEKKAKTKEADLSESIGSAAMCKGCGKVKEACGCYEKKAEIHYHVRSGLGGYGYGPNVDIERAKLTPQQEAKYQEFQRQRRNQALLAAGVVGGGLLLHHHLAKARMPKMAAAEKLKTALREKLASGAPPDWNKAMLAATTGLGALAGGVGTYLASRAQKDTGKSKMEEDLGSQVEANKMKPERGFLQKLKNRETENAHGFARAFREHPVKASLLGTLTGAVSGYGIGQLGGAIARRGGK